MKFGENMVFHQISSNFIKFHQKNQGFEKKMNFDEIWWILMKTCFFIKFHQKNQGFEKKMNFDEIWWKHGFSSNFIKFQQFSSRFIKVHQNSSKLNSLEKKATTSDWNQI